MKKYDNFVSCLTVLEQVDFALTDQYEIVKTGIVGQFNLTFEMTWKLLKQIMLNDNITDFAHGSPREIIMTAYQFHYLDHLPIWSQMLKDRNLNIHVYDEQAFNQLVDKIHHDYIPALVNLKTSLTPIVARQDTTITTG